MCDVSSLTMRQIGQLLSGVISMACGVLASASEKWSALLCNDLCVTMSGTTMDPGSKGGNMDGLGSVRSFIAV